MQEHRDKPVLLGFWNISLLEFSCIFGAGLNCRSFVYFTSHKR